MEYGHASRLEGGEGNDNLTDFGNNNVLLGGAGADGVGINGNANALDGGDGADWVGCTVTGDSLSGGSGADSFALAGSGRNTVVDFSIAQGDVFDLSGSGVANFGTLTLSQSRTNTVISFNGAAHITLNNLLATDLTVGQFIFG